MIKSYKYLYDANKQYESIPSENEEIKKVIYKEEIKEPEETKDRNEPKWKLNQQQIEFILERLQKFISNAEEIFEDPNENI